VAEDGERGAWEGCDFGDAWERGCGE